MSTTGPAGTHRRPRILIVEDHDDTRQMYAEFLCGEYEVVEARDGAEGLTLARERRPDVLVTDLSLPVIDGFELVEKVRSDPALGAMAIICMSGYGGHRHDERARAVGCDRILQKPCMPDTLASVAEELLRERAGEA